MKRHALSTTLMLAFGALLAAQALLADDHHRCTYSGGAGDWGYTATGIRNGVGPVAAVGGFTLDSDGNILNGKQTISFNGFIAEETFSGTYTINADCTGSATVDVVSPVLNRTSHLSLVRVNNENEAHQIFTDAGTVITLEAKKLFSHAD